MKSLLTAAVLLALLAAAPAWTQWTGGPSGPIYYDSGNVGIGTTNPQTKLQINSYVDGEGEAAYHGSLILADPEAASSLNGSLGLEFKASPAGAGFGWKIGGSGNYGIDLAIGTRQNSASWSEVIHLAASGNVGIGTTAPTDALDVNGTIAATEVKVEATVPDFVFEPSYHLQSLSEVKQFVEGHHHLPDIPSAAEVKEKGLSLGEMQAKLLGKIEELTLHMIQAEERNNRLEERNDRLEQEVKDLQERLVTTASVNGSANSK